MPFFIQQEQQPSQHCLDPMLICPLLLFMYALFQPLIHSTTPCECRDVTDSGLAELSHFQELQVLVMNSMSQNITGSFLSSLQSKLLPQNHLQHNTDQFTMCGSLLHMMHYLLIKIEGVRGYQHLANCFFMRLCVHFGETSKRITCRMHFANGISHMCLYYKA